jgi:hypothetical protein
MMEELDTVFQTPGRSFEPHGSSEEKMFGHVGTKNDVLRDLRVSAVKRGLE